MRKSLTIICPVFNEEQVIRIFYERLSLVLESLSDAYRWNILFVLDKSSDASSEIIKSIIQHDDRVGLLSMSSRFGHQMSLVAGIDHCKSDVIIMMDSDLQHPPEIVRDLLVKYEDGFDVVHAIRMKPADKSFLKGWGSRIFYRLLNWLSEVRIDAGGADFRLISSRVADVFQNSIREQNQFLRGLFNWVGFRQAVIEFEAQDRLHGKSKYDFSRLTRFAISGIISFSKKPLKFAVAIGFTAALFGFLYGVFTLINYFLVSQVPSGWTPLAILISFFGGVQLIFLGVIGEYLGAIFDEVKKRPLYLIDESINVD